MTRQHNRLSVRQIQTNSAPGRYPDGGGLYLAVAPGGSKSWVFRYRSPTQRTELDGKAVGKIREMGLGSASGATAVTLAEARDAAIAARKLLAARMDPQDRAHTPPPKIIPTFAQFVAELLPRLELAWRNPKHRAQWRSTLDNYGSALANLPLDQIETKHVLAVLTPIWTIKAETASRLRGRIEKVLDAARAAGHRAGENPARWRGHLDHLLAARQKLQRGHHRALPWKEIPGFMTRVRAAEGIGALAVRFLILTAARSGEVRGSRWGEMNLEAAVWTVPASRMKAGRPHRVPLTDQALVALEQLLPFRASPDDLVFPGAKQHQALSDMSLSAVLRRMGLEFTVHGFRSSFKDWATEATTFPNELSEAALAHVTGDATERAYRRGDALERRRELMAEWGRFCEMKQEDFDETGASL